LKRFQLNTIASTCSAMTADTASRFQQLLATSPRAALARVYAMNHAGHALQ
jgi:hypothetical protein